MKRAWWTAVLSVVVTACQCGPGVACREDSACAPWGQCSPSGFCVVRREAPGDAGAGTPRLRLAADTLELGPVACGESATGAVELTNEGDVPLEVSLRSNNPAFVVASALTLPPGGRAPLTVEARAPSDALAGQRLEGVITVDSKDARVPRAFVAVSARARGATLVVSPPVTSFGTVPLGVDAGATLTVRNTGTDTAEVSLGALDDGQFGFSVPGFALDAGASVTLEARFSPTRPGPAGTTVALNTTSTVCGASATALELRGQGTTGLVGLSTAEVYFGADGRVDCGTTAAAQTLTLFNAGSAAFAWSTSLGKGTQSPFTVSPASGTLLGNGQVTLTLTSTAIPARASTMEGAFSDVLTLATDSPGDQPHAITLHQSAHGAVLRLSPAVVQFGGVPLTSSATAPVSVINEGSAAIDVAWTIGPAAFSLEPNAPTRASPGSSTATVRFEPGMELMPQAGTLSLSVDGGALCAALPMPVELRGSGTSGSVGYSPVALDFGEVSCGSTAAPQTVTFTNSGNQPYRVTAQLARADSPYTLSLSPADGTVAADGGTLQLVVTPQPVPATSAVTTNLYGDTLTVTTDVAGDVPHDLPLTMTARGAIFSFSTSTLQFGDVAVGSQGTAQFTVINSGNASGTLQLAAGSTGRFTLPASVTVAGGASTPVLGTFAPTMQVQVSDSAALSVSGQTVLCQPLPAQPGGPPRLGLEGRGTNTPVVAQSTSSLTFGTGGLVPCGTQASAKSFTLRNDSTQVLSLTPTLTGNVSAYTIDCPAMLAVGATATVTVTPNAIPQSADTTADFFGATLTIRAQGGPVSEEHAIALHMTAQGARLAFSTTALRNFDGTSTQAFTVLNSGNAPAQVTLSLANTSNGYTRAPAGTATVPTSGLVGSVSFSRPLLVLGNVTNSLSMASTSTLCAPLPDPLALSSSP